jgi:hypothetical protein
MEKAEIAGTSPWDYTGWGREMRACSEEVFDKKILP